MKVTDVRTYVMRGVERNWVFVKVCTDEGIHGWGEASLEWKERTVEQAVHEVARHVIGKDPTRIEHLWQTMFRHGFWRGGVILNTALSGIDQALWDITGKAYGVPVYKLLGGACRERIRLYGHGGPQTALELRDLGFTAMKTGAGSPDQVKANLEAIRGNVGDAFDIMIDNHGMSTPQEAHQQILAAEPYRLLFFEEPCPPDNPEVLAPLASSRYRTPLATGERLYTRWGFRQVIENQWVSVIQPDLCHAGGISEVRRIAAMAETYYIQVVPHNPYGPVSTAACVHLCAAIPNFLILEYVFTNEPWRTRVQKDPLIIREGHAELPTSPGLGIDLDEDVIASRPFTEDGIAGRFADDGGVQDI
ncbi:galactonate dehydratase [Candidatus Poribacteria bacterium]|nr:galactonate dehydratase [Candidatus Poribacteria bacterium]